MLKKIVLAFLVFSLLSISVLAYECNDKCKIQENSCLCPSAPMWVSQDSPLKVLIGNETHIVKVIDVTENSDSCGISVDDNMKWFSKGQTIKINGINVVVFDMITVHSQLESNDACKLFIAGTVILPVEKLSGLKNATENQAVPAAVNVTSNITANETPENLTVPPVQEQTKTVWQLIIDWLLNLYRK